MPAYPNGSSSNQPNHKQDTPEAKVDIVAEVVEAEVLPRKTRKPYVELSPEKKLEVAKRYEVGVPTSQLVEEYGISERTVETIASNSDNLPANLDDEEAVKLGLRLPKNANAEQIAAYKKELIADMLEVAKLANKELRRRYSKADYVSRSTEANLTIASGVATQRSLELERGTQQETSTDWKAITGLIQGNSATVSHTAVEVKPSSE